ncbi:MAG: hypothetical protein MUF34_33685 [Polyangiaceae bacterium]|jgi:hypothetical protein|nr:hypothetical protein [Polyangiaceae bacterium]
MFAAAVILSVVGLLVGPLLASWARGSSTTFAALDGATLGIVPALVLLRLLPHFVEEAGAAALVACGVGYLALAAVEARAHARAADVGVALVLPALALHGFLDGAGLAVALQREEALGADALAVGAALVAHKVPEGLFVASVLLPALGPRRTVARLLALAAATVGGALTGHELLARLPERELHVAVAAGLGVMLRMAIHRHGAPPQTRAERRASGLAFVGCLGALLAAPDPRHLLGRAQPGELTALQALAPLLLETSPWLLLALLVGEVLARRGRDADDEGARTGTMWLPAVALSLPLLGAAFTLVRAALEPLGGAWRPPHHDGAARPSVWQPRRLALLAARLAPPAKQILPSYAVGVGLAIAVEATAPGGVLRAAGWLAAPLALALALAAAAARVGAAGVTVLTALLVHKGLSLPAALVFSTLAGRGLGPLWGGRAERSWASMARALAALALGALVMHWANLTEAPALHGLAAHDHPWLEWSAAAVLAACMLSQLVFSGPRAWFAALRPSPGADGAASPPR